MIKIKILAWFLIIPTLLFAQQKITHTNMIWVSYHSNIHLDSNWSIVNDVQLRTRDWTENWSQFALRTGAVYKLKKNISVTAGFAWFGNVSYFEHKPLVANEWRPWQEISFQKGIKKIQIIQRIRLEQRFLQQVQNDKKMHLFETRHRLRYRFELGYPLINHAYVILAGNETMVNLNYAGDPRFFDQNRTYLSVNRKVSGSTIFQLQYIRLVQWRAAVKELENNNVFRLSIQQQL